jgi:YVTN family beta-propeller protein
MNLRSFGLLAITAFIVAGLLGGAQSLAQNAFIANAGSNNVSVIDSATNAMTATIPVGSFPFGVAASPDGRKVYITNANTNTASVIVAVTVLVAVSITDTVLETAFTT